MFNIMYTMTYSTFMKWQIAAMVTGASIVGSFWLLEKWQKAYEEARENGAVA